MQIPFDLVSLSLWFAFTGITLLITTRLVSIYDGDATLIIDQRKLRNAALIVGTLFVVLVTINIFVH